MWGPDELQRMHDIGNERAATLYGGIEQRPDRNASDALWLKYLKEKYELKKWASKEASIVTMMPTPTTSQETSKTSPALSETTNAFESMNLDWASAMNAFANVSTYSNATIKPKKDIFHQSNKTPVAAAQAPPCPIPNVLEQNLPATKSPVSPRQQIDFFAEFGL